MNENIAKSIYHAGIRLRNPSLNEQYDFLKETEWWSLEKLRALQAKKAEKFFRFVSENSKFYNNILKSSGFNFSGDFCSTELRKLPELNKSILVSNKDAIQIFFNEEKMRLAETSGTSGEGLEFFRNERWDSLNRATMMRSYDWYGVKVWQRNGYLWGFNIKPRQATKIRALDYMQNRFRLFNYSENDIVDFCKKLKQAEFISGYSSMVFEVAKRINELGLGPVPLKMVKGTSEMILDSYQKESFKAFGSKIVSEYGAAESGIIAFECPVGGLHINIENLIVETNDSSEILVTNLASRSFPIIRYNLGDVVELDSATCSCGRSHPLIKNIVGRRGSKVLGLEREYPALTFYYVFKNLALEESVLLNYKAVQKEKGKVEIFIEGSYEKNICDLVCQQLRRYFADDISFELNFVKQFEIKQQKRQYFESQI
ncbi:phenylacetate--CoA ligase family protein [Marinobacter salinisoli]|uniref:Phenylacetate--CoA ligase family protein n=1 Tax=Marinobacter salinisoli TaxID=2769486 RepID=A0ABX7MN51_9GAMM|nr:phenylacetate--CoA ligase family protein [Marinobacter salinisoli]QSP93675.1 phenylacetate--CoA ligase family protein [Marinobacter salinisoli]